MQKREFKLNLDEFKGDAEKGFKCLKNFMIFKMIKKKGKLELIVLPGFDTTGVTVDGVIICIPRHEIHPVGTAEQINVI